MTIAAVLGMYLCWVVILDEVFFFLYSKPSPSSSSGVKEGSSKDGSSAATSPTGRPPPSLLLRRYVLVSPTPDKRHHFTFPPSLPSLPPSPSPQSLQQIPMDERPSPPRQRPIGVELGLECGVRQRFLRLPFHLSGLAPPLLGPLPPGLASEKMAPRERGKKESGRMERPTKAEAGVAGAGLCRGL